ncbi:hypothetical protein [Aeromonas media]|uniref:hypothetical protein n=1 Tax=Aeromonas media TaxID=651 RepID=UPI003D19B650
MPKQEAPKAPMVVQDDINGVTAKSLEGKEYQVFLGAAYLGVRDQLKDGEVLTLKDVKLVPSSYDHGYFQAHFLDASGAQLFTDYYSLSDVGLLDSRLMAIETSVSEGKVNQGRGEMLHGKTPEQAGKDSTYLYMSTSNGEKVRAYPVSLIKGDSKPKPLSYGLSFSCSKGQMYGVASFSEPFIALNEGAKLKFSFPGQVNITVRGEAIDSESVFFSIPQKLEKKLINAEAGELWVHPDANGPERFPWRNNGMAEAYTRVKRHCNG